MTIPYFCQKVKCLGDSLAKRGKINAIPPPAVGHSSGKLPGTCVLVPRVFLFPQTRSACGGAFVGETVWNSRPGPPCVSLSADTIRLRWGTRRGNCLELASCSPCVSLSADTIHLRWGKVKQRGKIVCSEKEACVRFCTKNRGGFAF